MGLLLQRGIPCNYIPVQLGKSTNGKDLLIEISKTSKNILVCISKLFKNMQENVPLHLLRKFILEENSKFSQHKSCVDYFKCE